MAIGNTPTGPVMERGAMLELARSAFPPFVVRNATDDELIRLWQTEGSLEQTTAALLLIIDGWRKADDAPQPSALDAAAAVPTSTQVESYLASETAEFVASLDRVFAQLGELKRRATDRTLTPTETLAACRVACGLMDDCARYADAVHHIAFHDTVAESLDDTLARAGNTVADSKHEGRPSTSSQVTKQVTKHDTPPAADPSAQAESLSPPAVVASPDAAAASAAHD